MKTAKDGIELPEEEKEIIMLKVIRKTNEDQKAIMEWFDEIAEAIPADADIMETINKNFTNLI